MLGQRAAARSPARPCRWTPHIAAWAGSIPWAISEAIIPASTSPLPAAAILDCRFCSAERHGLGGNNGLIAPP